MATHLRKQGFWADLSARSLQSRWTISAAGCICVLIAIAALFGCTTTLTAQTSQATIRGTVRDTTNASIVGASLTLTNVDTHVVSKTTTNAQGDYLFLNINPGTYTLAASAKAFSTSELQPFKLQVNQTSVLNFTLSVGSASEVVQVEATGDQLQAATAELGLTLEAKQVQDLPLNARNFTALVLTAPGVSPISVGGSQTLNYTTSIGPAIVPSFNGQTQRSNIFVLDGVLDLETFGNAYAVQPSLEAIQDMKMEAHVDSAEFGGSSGGTVNIATKGGTNQLHGSAWEYNQTPGYQALGYFTPHGTRRTSFKQNQFGGAIGGPVVLPKLYNGRNKTFFFGQYEDYRRSGTSSWSGLVPTDAELAGDFTQGNDITVPIYDPASTTCDASGNCTRTQFSYIGVKNVIPPNRINAANVAYMKTIYPRPTASAPPGSNSYQTFASSTDYYTYDWRVDENFGTKDTAFFRWTALKGNRSTPNRLNYSNVSSTHAYTYAGSYVHIFSPKSVLHVEAGRTYEQMSLDYKYSGVTQSSFNSSMGFPAGLTSGYVTIGNVIPGFALSNYVSDFGTFSNPITSANSWSVRSDYNFVLGKHTLKIGGSYDSIGEAQDIEWGQVGFNPQETNSLHDGTGTYAKVTGNSVASMDVNAVSGFTKRNVAEGLTPGGVMGYFAQDQIQINSNLTVNVGLRYDLALIPKYGNPGQPNQYSGNFDFSNGTYIVLKVPGSCATLGNAPCIPTADGSLPAHVVASKDGKVLQNQYDNWQPRIGASYRITPTTVLRGGIGLTFDNYAGLVQNLRGVSGNWPGVGQVAQSNVNLPTPANPFPGYSTQNLPAMTALPAATPFNQVNWFIAPNSKDAYSLQYNFGVQRQLDQATVVSAGYAGSVNRRLNIGGYYNVAATPGPGNPVARRPFPYIAPTFYSWSGGNGNYNAMQVQLTRRFSKGLASTIAYTWGKSIDEGCSGFFGSEGCSVQQIYNISKAERSVSAFDVTHNLVASWNYALPVGRGKLVNVDNRFADFFIGNWQWSGFARFHSGTPFSPNLNADIANIGNTGYERPNLVGDPTPANRSYHNWLNYSAFAVPAQYTFGNIGRNQFRSQFYKSFDMSMFKEFLFSERYRLKITADAFNVFNQHTLGVPDSNLSHGDPAAGGRFGVISGTNGGPRGVQLSSKFTF